MGHGREIDRLNIDGVAVVQVVGSLLAEARITDEHGHDMARRGHNREIGLLEAALQQSRTVLVPLAQLLRSLDVADAGDRAGADRGRQGGGEDEARSVATKEIDHRRRARDIAADEAESLGERALDDIDALADPVALGNAAAMRAIEPDRMYLIEIGHGTEALRHVADLADRRDVAIHRIDRFESDELRLAWIGGAQQALEIGRIIVREDVLFGAA